MRFWQTPAFRWTALLAGALAWRLILFVGAQGSDDLAYSRAAWTVAGGVAPVDQGIHGNRIGYVGFIGALYALFGAGSFSLVFLNLLSSVAEVALARLVAREFLDDEGAWLAALLVALLPVHVFYATEAHPDLPVAALTTLSVLLFLRARKADSAALYLASGLALGSAHLMKETAFMGLAALAVLGGRPRRQYLHAVAGFAILVAFEMLFFWAAAGDPLHRVRGTGAQQAQIMSSEFYLRTAPTFRRLVVDVPAMFLWPGDGNFAYFALLPLLAVGGTVEAWRRRDVSLRGPAGWALGLVALLTFWPVTLLPYRPAMVAFPRIFLVAAVPMAILAASFLRRIPVKAAATVFAAAALLSIGAALVLHGDGRRESAGARLAHAATLDLPVVSDPRTIEFLRLYDGYRPGRELRAWDRPLPKPHYRVINGIWIRNIQTWNGISPPPGFEDPGVAPLRTEIIPGRLRLRSLLRGKIERVGAEELRIYKMP
ncbi:MAG TPA: glycosyltransferase family 39 protein [Planctomycetota bacterium]|nr:glycosyltransferase family 39 protein [Planctomycetota bacterium]